MIGHQNHPGLDELPALVKKQRRLVAGMLRIVREEKAMRVEMDALLERAGVEQVTCDGYIVLRTERAGDRFVVVNPVSKAVAPTAGQG